MPLVAAKCTQCGASLDVDPEKEAAICPFCHTPFITEKAINNYNTTNITNIGSINAGVVNVESSDSAAMLSRNAETLMSFGEWEKAKAIYVKITEMYPFDWKGWYGLLQTNTHNFQLQFDRYEEYNALVGIYERLVAVSNDSMPNLAEAKGYLNNIYMKVETTTTNNYKRDQQFLQEQIIKENALVKDEIPLEVKDKKTLGTKITKIIWFVWVAIAFLVSLAQGIGTNIFGISGYALDIEFGFFHFANMDYFLDTILYMSVFMLIIQVVVSSVLFGIGAFGVVAQKHSKQKRLTAFKFMTKCSIIAVSSHLIFWLITIIFVGSNDPGYFFTYTGIYRYIDTILFHFKATETGACWIALLLIIIYSVINYVLIATPLFVTERIGDSKRSAILLNIQHKHELVRLMEQRETLPKRYNEDLLKLKMIRDKHL